MLASSLMYLTIWAPIAARKMQDRGREFIRNQPAVYCGTHATQGYENPEAWCVRDPDNQISAVFAEVVFSE